MPLLPFALRAIYNATNDTTILADLVPKLVSYYEWWANTRDIDGNGLVTIIHGWESGLDASPAYDLMLDIHVPQPTFDELYPKFDELVYAYKLRFDWNQSSILGQTEKGVHLLDGYFLVQDVGVNSVYAAGWRILGQLAATFDPELSALCLYTILLCCVVCL